MRKTNASRDNWSKFVEIDEEMVFQAVWGLSSDKLLIISRKFIYNSTFMTTIRLVLQRRLIKYRQLYQKKII